MRDISDRPSGLSHSRNFLIDVMRGFAILIVMMLHGAVPVPHFVRTHQFLLNIRSNGSFGVDVFFVISGFLISGNTLRRYGSLSAISVRSFYAMRIARIFPCLALFSIVFVAINRLGVQSFVPDNPVFLWRGIQSIFTLRFNYFYFTEGNIRGLLPMAPLWSIAVEETFYLLFPIACFLCLRDRFALVLISTLLVIGPYLRDGFLDTLTLPGVVDLLAMGCLTALIVQAFGERHLPRFVGGAIVLGSATLLLTAMSMLSARFDIRFGLSLIGLLTSVYLFASSAVVCSFYLGFLFWPLAFLGRMSLQLYVFHVVFRDVGAAIGLPVWFTFILVIAAAWGLEWAFLEPCNRYIRRLYVRSSPILPSRDIIRPAASAGPVAQAASAAP